MQRNTRRWLIGGAITLVVITGLYFAISGYIGYQETAQQNLQLTKAPVQGVTQVALSNFAIGPAKIEVPLGTTVTWTNDDDAPHSVTFDNGMADSGIFHKGQTYQYTFTKAGTFAYHCSVHPGMVARVIVTP